MDRKSHLSILDTVSMTIKRPVQTFLKFIWFLGVFLISWIANSNLKQQLCSSATPESTLQIARYVFRWVKKSFFGIQIVQFWCYHHNNCHGPNPIRKISAQIFMLRYRSIRGAKNVNETDLMVKFQWRVKFYSELFLSDPLLIDYSHQLHGEYI